MELTGSQIVIECLKEQGVDTVFGYPGGTILNIYDELYRHPEIHHILTSHEQGAAHAADGYARATGKTGVCMATSGLVRQILSLELQLLHGLYPDGSHHLQRRKGTAWKRQLSGD